MPTLTFTVWHNAGATGSGPVLQEENIAIGATSAQGSAISGSGETRKVRIFCDVNAYVTWGSDPTAASGSARPMGLENPEYFEINAGDKVAVLERV